MKLLLRPYFVLFVGLYILIRLLRHLEFYIPETINSHLTDFLFIPILLTVSLVGVRAIKRDQKIKLTDGMIVVTTVLVSIMFEAVMPSRSSLFVKDYWDIAAYGLGALFFYWLQKKSEIKISKPVSQLF